MKTRIDPIDREHLEQVLASRGYQLIQTRMKEAAASKLRALRLDSDHYETGKLRGFLEGMQAALAIPEVLLQESTPKVKAKER
jgi:hypothetical protein